jgi:23S rRNA pseudouridine2605 synthase
MALCHEAPTVAAIKGPQSGQARYRSKLGACSRSEAWRLIESGRVRLNGVSCRNAERPVDLRRDRVEVDGQPVAAARKIHLALNKPRGLVTKTLDKRGRDTVYQCFEGASLPCCASCAWPSTLFNSAIWPGVPGGN